LLIPLALTSTNGMVRRLGGKRWQWLHRLMYLIVPLGVLHFWWMKAGKNLLAQPILLQQLFQCCFCSVSGTKPKPKNRCKAL